MPTRHKRFLSAIFLIASTTNLSGCAAFAVLGAASDVAVTSVKVTTSIATSVAKAAIPDDQDNKK